MKDYGLVSCIIPSYKRNDTLKRAIDSVLAQTYPNIEIIVVDDNNPGDEYSLALHDIIKSYNNDRIKLITQKKHINGAVARNEGVKASSGEYIAFLDDDDEWLPTKTEQQLKILTSDSSLGGIAGGATLWREGKEVSKLPKKEISENNLLLKVLIREVDLTTPSFMCKKSAFIKAGGFNPTLRRSQDLQLFADFLNKYRIYPIWNFKTVKVHVESTINRLGASDLVKHKEEYFKSIAHIINAFPTKTRRRIKSAHYYEVAFVAIKNKRYLFALRYILKGLTSFISLKDLYIRAKNRV